MQTFYQIVIVALVAAFIILVLGKTGLRDKIRDYCDKVGIPVVAEMLECDFCLSFWTCVFVALCFWALAWEPHLLVIFCAPPITRYLL